MSETLYLIDGSGFIFRAYHALPPLNRPDGTPVNAVLGFTNMLVKLLKDKGAHHVAVIFDAARKNFRNDIYPEYKAHRPPPPEDLVPQFPLIRDATRAFSLPGVEQEGFEADDLIATYARLAVEAHMDVVIVSSDKDLMQLVRPGVALMDPMKQTMMGADAVFEKFGVPPDKVVEVQALCGDGVDNVPGVPGIGVKTAAELINTFGDVETLLSRLDEIKQPKRRETLIQNADAARISRRLVMLDAHVPVVTPLDDLRVRDASMPDLAAFLAEQGFKSVLTRMGQPQPLRAGGGAQDIVDTRSSGQARGSDSARGTIPVQFPDTRTYTMINTMEVLDDWMAQARTAGVLAIDTETTGLTPAKAKLVGISICITPGIAAYIPVGHQTGGDLFGDNQQTPILQLPIADVMARLKSVLEDHSILKIGHNIKYDLQMFYPHGIMMAPIADTMMMSYALDNTRHGHGLEELGRDTLGMETISYDSVTGTGKARITFDAVPIDRARDYAAEDADLTMRLYHLLSPRIQAEHINYIYEDIDRAVISVVARMEYTGIRVDVPLLQSLSHDFGIQLSQLESDIQAAAGHPFNVNSPKQLGVVLFDELGLPGGTRTKTGDWSTSADILEDLASQGHDVVQQVLDYRGLAKLKSTYTDALPLEINPSTGRIHTSYGLALTSTGRLSSSDPNLQNIPIRTENGRKIRKAFITDPGWTLVSVDYSQIELRLIAEIAGIPALTQAFIDGADIHAITASQVFGVPIDGMDPMIRRQAKAINFGIIYGISGFGLARQLGCDTQTANGYIKAYFEKFPELKQYFETAKDQARKTGIVTTTFGRRIVIDGINDKNGARRAFAERQAINAPIQGTAADLMKCAMSRVPRALEQAGLQARLLLQVHDELVLEAPVDQAEATARVVKHVMEEASPFTVPVVAEYGIGPNWDDAH
jgi:DNA polymerase-1